MIRKIKSSLRAKLFLSGAMLVIFFVLFNVLSTYLFLIPFSAKQSVNKMKNIAIDIVSKDSGIDEDFEDYIDEIASDYNVKVMLIDDDENILYTSRKQDLNSIKLTHRVHVMFQINKERLDQGETIGVSKIADKDITEPIRCIVIKKMNDDSYLILTRTLRSLQNTEVVVLYFDIIVAGITLLVGFFMIFVYGKRITRPINEMTIVAERISHLDFEKKVELTKEQDEIGRLGTAINQMSDHLEQNINEMKQDIENRKSLVRNLSHEIKSPIAVIMAYSDRLKAIAYSKPDQAMEYSEIISNESSRIDNLVQEMLRLSRTEKELEFINHQTFNVKDMLLDVIAIAKTECELNDSVIDYKLDDTYILKGNMEFIKRAIYNVVNNGMKYGSGSPTKISIHVYEQNKMCCIDVHNTGSQIAEEDLPFIWDTFYKADKVRNREQIGYGIGLAIVREIVERHNGICVANNFEDGVSVVLSFPLNL